MQSQGQNNEKRNWLFVLLAGLFITNAITAELISSKIISIPVTLGHMAL